MALTVDLDDGRKLCTESIRAFVRGVTGLDELALLGASRCHGWTRLDVVTHVVSGWQEMLAGLVCPDDGEPDVDAASYWAAFAADYADSDPVLDLMSQRRRSAVYARPSSAVEHLLDLAAALERGVDTLSHQPRRWQGHVFGAGDFLAVWAVENVVHHLDLDCAEPAPPGCLRLVRRTVEARVGEPLPADWSDERAALVGAGRQPVPAGVDIPGLPALG